MAGEMLLAENSCAWPRNYLTIAGQPHDKFRVAGFRAESNDAAILLDDALDDAKPDSCADSDGFRGVEGIEDLRLAFERNADAVIADADAEVDVRVVRT